VLCSIVRLSAYPPAQNAMLLPYPTPDMNEVQIIHFRPREPLKRSYGSAWKGRPQVITLNPGILLIVSLFCKYSNLDDEKCTPTKHLTLPAAAACPQRLTLARRHHYKNRHYLLFRCRPRNPLHRISSSAWEGRRRRSFLPFCLAVPKSRVNPIPYDFRVDIIRVSIHISAQPRVNLGVRVNPLGLTLGLGLAP